MNRPAISFAQPSACFKGLGCRKIYTGKLIYGVDCHVPGTISSWFAFKRRLNRQSHIICACFALPILSNWRPSRAFKRANRKGHDPGTQCTPHKGPSNGEPKRPIPVWGLKEKSPSLRICPIRAVSYFAHPTKYTIYILWMD